MESKQNDVTKRVSKAPQGRFYDETISEQRFSEERDLLAIIAGGAVLVGCMTVSNPATAQQDKAPNDLEIAHIAAKFEDCDGVEV